MFYAAENDLVSMTEIKAFDTYDDMMHWAKWNGRLVLSPDVAEEILRMRRTPHRVPEGVYVSLCDPDNEVKAPIDEEFGYYAVEDNPINKLDIECFKTRSERDKWCAECNGYFGIPISRKLAEALLASYGYIEDVVFSRDGIAFVRD